MFWAALASLIMALTGEGDDTAPYRAYLQGLREAIAHEVAPERRKAALASVDAWYVTFRKHREGLQPAAKCVDEMDRRYDAKPEDYYRCFEGQDAVWQASVERLLSDRRHLSALLTEAEMQAIRKYTPR